MSDTLEELYLYAREAGLKPTWVTKQQDVFTFQMQVVTRSEPVLVYVTETVEDILYEAPVYDLHEVVEPSERLRLLEKCLKLNMPNERPYYHLDGDQISIAFAVPLLAHYDDSRRWFTVIYDKFKAELEHNVINANEGAL